MIPITRAIRGLFLDDQFRLQEGVTQVTTAYGTGTLSAINVNVYPPALSPKGRFVAVRAGVRIGSFGRAVALLIDMGEHRSRTATRVRPRPC